MFLRRNSRPIRSKNKAYSLIVCGLSVFLTCFGFIFYSFVYTSAATTVVTDSFTRTSSSGWGTNDTSQTYSLTGTSSDFAVSGGMGTMTMPSANTTRSVAVDSTSYQDINETVTFKTDKVPTGTALEVFLTGRRIDANNLYRAKFRLTTSGTVTVQAFKLVGGSETALGSQSTVSGLTYTADQLLHARISITGTNPTTIQMKAWADGSSEPGSYNSSTTDSESVLQTIGGVGLRANAPGSISNSPIVVSFDDYSVTTDDAVASPSPSPTPEPQSGDSLFQDTFTRSSTDTWGTSSGGNAYTVVTGNTSYLDVDGSSGTISLPSASKTMAVTGSGLSQEDVDIQFKVKTDQVPTGAASEFFIMARYVDLQNQYRAKFRFTTSNAMTVQASKLVANTETFLGTQTTVSGLTISSDTYVTVRMQVAGTSPTTIKIKAWLSSGSEPADWTYSTTDSESTLQVAGNIGLRANLPAGVTNAPIVFTVDDISAYTTDGAVASPTPAPQDGTAFAVDTFTRTSSNSWGTSDTGGDYSISSGSSSNFAVNGSVGTITNTASGTARAITLPDTSQKDVDILFKVKLDQLPAASAAEIFWLARYTSSSDQYRGKIRITSAGSVTLQATNVISGTETALGTQTGTGITYTADSYLWIRSQIVGTDPTTISMKAWLDGGVEPVDWTYVVDDYQTTALQGPGSFGIRTNIPSAVTNPPFTFTFDSLNVTTTDIDIYNPDVSPAPSTTPTPTPPGSSLTATIQLSQPTITSKLKVGVTHIQESINSGGNASAKANARGLLGQAAYYQNQHIIGFGVSNLWDDPSKDVADWNWTSLDSRVSLMRDTGAVPVLTLCCAPTWMVDSTWTPGKYSGGSNTDWSQLEKAPRDTYEDEFAYMVQQIVDRYDGVNLDTNGVAFPKIEYFQVWNEMKGLWDSGNNRWNYTKYNRMYGLIYDSIKEVRPEANVGGPYVRLSRYVYPNGSQTSSLSSSAYGTVDQRDMNVVTQWLTWLTTNTDNDGNYKAQFVTVDGSIHPKDVTDGTFPPDIYNAIQVYQDVDDWLNSQMTSIIGTNLPIWWAEDYVGKVNGTAILITPELYQPSALARMLYKHILGGTSTTLRWGPEEQVNSSGVAQGNHQNLFSSTRFSGGGQQYDNYYVYKNVKDYFSEGTEIYQVTFSPANLSVNVLASDKKAMLINTSATDLNVDLVAGSGSTSVSLPAYKVVLADVVTGPTPTPSPTPTPAPTSTTAPTSTPTPTPSTNPTPTPSSTPTPTPVLGVCSAVCLINSDCASNYCSYGSCRNNLCPEDNTCGCITTPSPSDSVGSPGGGSSGGGSNDSGSSGSSSGGGSSPSNVKGADLNGDGKINIFDLSAFLRKWNSLTNIVDVDLNHDGRVNVFDLSILLKSWSR